MGSRGSDYETDRKIREVNDMIRGLVIPQENHTGDMTAAEHILGYIEAISRRDRDLVKMMDKHAQYAFAESWRDKEGKKHRVSGKFLELRNRMLQLTPKELKQLAVPGMQESVKDVTARNGEIVIEFTEGTRRVFDPQVSMWPF